MENHNRNHSNSTMVPSPSESQEPFQNYNLNTTGIGLIIVPRGDIGFGFNVRGPINEGGAMKSINGELYAPMHQVTALLSGGNAEKAGLKVDDKILEINCTNVEGYKHKDVIDLLKSSPDPLVLTVVTSHNTSNFVNGNCKGIRQYQVSIPEYQLAEHRGSSYIVYNIYINDRLACCRRYNHFHKLFGFLKSQFPEHRFLTLPKKKLFALSDQQLMERRKGLETSLVSACSIKEVFESDVMKKFLVVDNNYDEEVLATMKVLMPDHTLIEVKVKPEDYTEQVYQRVANFLDLRTDVLPYFSLFEIGKENFERRLESSERPYEIFSQHNKTDLAPNISFKKWVFSPRIETIISRDPLALSLIYSQALESIKVGEILLGDRKLEIENLIVSGKQSEVLQIVRQMEGHNRVSFPHCVCDSRKDGHVVCSISYDNVQLIACTTAGQPEGNVLEFGWDRIENFWIHSDSFLFTFSRENKSPRTVAIFTDYNLYMLECFNLVTTERSENSLKDETRRFV